MPHDGRAVHVHLNSEEGDGDTLPGIKKHRGIGHTEPGSMAVAHVVLRRLIPIPSGRCRPLTVRFPGISVRRRRIPGDLPEDFRLINLQTLENRGSKYGINRRSLGEKVCQTAPPRLVKTRFLRHQRDVRALAFPTMREALGPNALKESPNAPVK